MANGIFESLDDIVTSIKGLNNLRQVDAEADPEKRRALEDKFISEREGKTRKRLFEGTGDAVRGRDADEGLDVREGLDPQRALDRRMQESGAEGDQRTSMQELQEKQMRARQIVSQHKAGEPVSDDDKRLVFEVVYDVIKGLSAKREELLEQQEQRYQQLA